MRLIMMWLTSVKTHIVKQVRVFYRQTNFISDSLNTRHIYRVHDLSY